jgi:hypothetical protein
VTTPEELTDATRLLLVCQVSVAVLALLGSTVAVNFAAEPTVTVAAGGMVTPVMSGVAPLFVIDPLPHPATTNNPNINTQAA